MEETHQESAPEKLNDQIRNRIDKLGKIREQGENPYANGSSPKDLAQPLHEAHDSSTKEELEALGKQVSVAGRLMARRDFGKAAFVRLTDRSGEIQLFVQKNALGEEGFAAYKDLDIGDVIYAEGTLFKTKTDELSVKTSQLKLLTKSLRPLPEKFHGLTDVETRYRQRYLDLMTSAESREVFRKRAQIIDTIREFFKSRDFMEVETPMMHPLISGAAAKPFKTHHNTLDMELFLRIAPELYLKRLVVGGFDRVFEINRNFRNEGISIQHNPEFTMIEFYQAYATYEDLIRLTKDLFLAIADRVVGSRTITYQGTEICLDGEWEQMTVEESVLKFSGFKDADQIRDRDALLKYISEKDHPHDPKSSTAKLLMVIFDEEVESQLIQPTFITHYPLDVSPLSRKNEKDPYLVDRFEFFIYGREIGNAFSELNDPMDQKERFLAQVKAKEAGDDEACDMDEDYITALEYGMPPAAGQGIGIDRLVMLFTDRASIRDVILFPQLKSKV